MVIILKILAILGFVELVWTEDYSGECRLRKVRTTAFGRRTVKGILWTYGKLEDDGTISDGRYMRRWKPYRSPKK